ncbi:MAG: hypothetical protein HKN81_02790 [Gammaproteobacteria bacterium]|nr:hypothetical protein [Gammaproteobacteria bacterium]
MTIVASNNLSGMAMVDSRRLIGAALLAITLLVTGCGPGSFEPAEAPVQIDRAPTEPDEIAKQVVAGLLSIPVAEITLVSVEAKDFGDPSLGCPEPGMAYPQVITPGHRVIVEADGRRFDVRVSGRHGRICRKPGRTGPSRDSDGDRPENSSPVTSQIDQARANLAARLDLEAGDIRVTDVRPYEPGIASPGCRPDCGTSADGCGYLIGLFFDGRRYEYHSHDGRTEPCPALSAI